MNEIKVIRLNTNRRAIAEIRRLIPIIRLGFADLKKKRRELEKAKEQVK